MTLCSVALTLALTQTPVAPERHAGWLHAALIAHATAQAADLATTQYALGTGRYREANPLLRPIAGGPIRMAIVKSALAVTTSYLLLKMHKTHPKWAFIIATGATVFASTVAARNARFTTNGRH